MYWLSSCPRCSNGDLYLDEDDCRHCIQCGYVDSAAKSEEKAVDPLVWRWIVGATAEPSVHTPLRVVPDRDDAMAMLAQAS